ncbi:DNA repair protein RadA/Sms [Desulfitispora alkaliphila]|uniref:DNA repair protein RadA n=1 Tax=Desulfitispora alkaliphila TaxID=622674 RepID=UPI003D1B4E89
MAQAKVHFFCQQCGHESLKWLGKCPGCGEWNSFVEELAGKKGGKGGKINIPLQEKPKPIKHINLKDEDRMPLGIDEFDRVLGGGIVPGSLVLVGGDPGIGKSTLLLQAASNVSSNQGKVLYVSGEESVRQIALRAKRMECFQDKLSLLAQTDIELIEQQIELEAPQLVVIDSVQTIFHSDIQSAPGSVSQVRECTGYLLRLAKTKNVPIILVGHVTKEGNIAGPRMLEHMVDAVLYLEGERHNSFRILRGVKNRFGSTNEMGIFEMREKGLVPVLNPSEMFLSERPVGASGSVVVPFIEGTRPMLVEIQALVSSSSFGNPRRLTTGLDSNRVALLLAVMEKRAGLHLGNYDAFVNVVGGVRVLEPAADLGIVTAVASSLKDMPISGKTIVMGEVGLTGEVRAISQIEKRINEAAKLGFSRCIIPKGSLTGLDASGLKISGVQDIREALEIALGGE